MDSQSLKLRAENTRLRERLSELELELEDAREALKQAQDEAQSRWEAIGRLAPAAKRLRLERDQLKAKLEQMTAKSGSAT